MQIIQNRGHKGKGDHDPSHSGWSGLVQQGFVCGDFSHNIKFFRHNRFVHIQAEAEI